MKLFKSKTQQLETMKTITIGQHKGINHVGECHDKHLKQIKEQWNSFSKEK